MLFLSHIISFFTHLAFSSFTKFCQQMAQTVNKNMRPLLARSLCFETQQLSLKLQSISRVIQSFEVVHTILAAHLIVSRIPNSDFLDFFAQAIHSKDQAS